MPYEGEYAQYRSLRRLAENERVKELLTSFRVQVNARDSVPLNTLDVSDLPSSEGFPSWVLAVDGSHAEVRIQNGYPQAEASYVTVASVLINVAKVKELDQHRPVDPQEFRRTEQAQSIDCALPSCNVVFEGERSARDSLRRTVFEVFAGNGIWEGTGSLLDTFEALLEYKPSVKDQQCPYDDCPESAPFRRGQGRYSCPCPLNRSFYSTDALRVYEGMNAEGTNGAMFAEIMQVLERIWIIHCLRTFEQKQWLNILRELAIVLDGPLGVFGHPAWLSKAIGAELSRINGKVREATGGQDLLLLGVEKTGSFVQHFNDLDRSGENGFERIDPQTVVLLDDAYIKRHIIFSTSEKPYGTDTYFGRKFFYKTRSGAKIVASLPFLSEHHRDVTNAEPNNYPRLADAIGLLDQLVSSRYPNAIAPLVAAHAEAAIPLHLGGQVLERIARELVRGSSR